MENKLSEEKIIEVINKILRCKKVDGLYASVDVVFEAIQGLLDLYKRNEESCTKYLAEIGQLRTKLHAEKENNKELEHQIQVEIEGRKILVNLIENLKEELNKEKEQNTIQRKMLNDAFDRGWIHKDKLKEIFEEFSEFGVYIKIKELLEE